MTDNSSKDSELGLIAFQIQQFKESFKEIGILPPNSSFGELALLSNKPRSVTIRAKTDSHFAVLEKEDYKRV